MEDNKTFLGILCEWVSKPTCLRCSRFLQSARNRKAERLAGAGLRGILAKSAGQVQSATGLDLMLDVPVWKRTKPLCYPSESPFLLATGRLATVRLYPAR